MAPRVVHITTVHDLRDPRIFRKELGTLVRAGYDVHLIARHPTDVVIDDVQIHGLPSLTGRIRRLALLPAVYRIAVRLGASLYHIHDPELLPVAAAIKRATGGALVYDKHELYTRRPGLKARVVPMAEQAMMRAIDHVIFVADDRDGLSLKGRPSTVIENYYLPDPGTSFGINVPERGTPVRLIYAGVQALDRGLGYLLDVMDRLAAEDRRYQLVLAGVCYRGAERQWFEKERVRRGLEASIQMIGWSEYLPWRDLVRLYDDAHVGIALTDPQRNNLTSIPTKFYEFLHNGRPFIASDIPLWRKFIEANGCGRAVDPANVEQVVAAIRAMTDSPEEYRGLAESCLSNAQKYYWEQMEPRLLGIYQELTD